MRQRRKLSAIRGTWVPGSIFGQLFGVRQWSTRPVAIRVACLVHAELYSPGPSTSLNHFYASCFAYIQALCMRHRDSILGASWHLVTYRGDQRERNQKQCTSVLHSKLDPKTSLKCVELRSSGLQKATGQEVFPASWISSTC
jgi:hypothetical protein